MRPIDESRLDDAIMAVVRCTSLLVMRPHFGELTFGRLKTLVDWYERTELAASEAESMVKLVAMPKDAIWMNKAPKDSKLAKIS